MDIREKALLIHKRLCATYHCPIPYFHNLDPLSELISSLLSHRTRNKDSGNAFKKLRSRFPTWELVRDASVEDIQSAIEVVTWPEQKAPRIQAILRTLSERCGDPLNLEFLADMPPIEARHWLESLQGVGPKTSAAVLLFSTLRIPALPVDCHHQRVAERLELIKKKLNPVKMHDILAKQLPDDFSAQEVYDNHEILMLHGQRCCFIQNPACSRCSVLDLCPEGQLRRHQVSSQNRELQQDSP
ncbi:MAG: Fe-S cluster assembly protein HesB [Proteobacteria bacterium]|nr:MAG: Fe-S cluster assembly protein HesB [Pseudomonadota bacterium]